MSPPAHMRQCVPFHRRETLEALEVGGGTGSHHGPGSAVSRETRAVASAGCAFSPARKARATVAGVDTAAAEARKAAAQLDLIKLSSMEVVEGDSRAFIAHSRSLSKRSLRSRENSYSQLPLVRDPSLAASDASGSLMSAGASLPPRKFLVDGRRSGRERDGEGDGSATLPRNISAANMKSGSGMLGPQRSLTSTPELIAEGGTSPPRPSSGGLPPLPPAPSVPQPSAEPATLEVMSSALTSAASSISVFPCLVPRGDVPVLSRLSARANPGELPASGVPQHSPLFCAETILVNLPM